MENRNMRQARRSPSVSEVHRLILMATRLSESPKSKAAREFIQGMALYVKFGLCCGPTLSLSSSAKTRASRGNAPKRVSCSSAPRGKPWRPWEIRGAQC